MKLLRLDNTVFPVGTYEMELYKKAGFDEVVEIQGESPDEIVRAGAHADVVVVVSNYLRADVIDKLEKCRLIVRRGTGYDKIDVDCATARGIIVTNLPDFACDIVADHAIMLMLALARSLPVMEHAMADRNWISVRNGNPLVKLGGKTLGIIGFGMIGREIARRAKAFDMEVVDYHRRVNPEIEAQYGVTPVPLEELLARSDFIVIACPLTPETEGMIGGGELVKMKSTAYLINIGRGGVTDELALAQALKNREIAGAGIDVYEHVNVFTPPESSQKDCYYVGLDNVILTPHVAANAAETGRQSIEAAMEQINMVLNGIFPANCVNPEVYEKVKTKYVKH